MFWYSVSLLFKSIHSLKSDVEPLWEERIVLLRTDTEDNAKKEAMLIGKELEHTYSVKTGEEGDIVKWTFKQIERVYQIEDENLKNGTELFSRFLRNSEVKSLLTPFEDK